MEGRCVFRGRSGPAVGVVRGFWGGWRATAGRCGAGWRPVDRGAGWPGRGYPRPPSTPLRLSTSRTSTPQSSSGGRRGRGAGRGRWSEQPVQERDQGDDASLDQEGIPDPDEEVASVDDGGVAGPWLQHWVPPPGCRRPLGLVLPSCSALEQGHHSHRDWDPPGLPRHGRADIRRPPHRSGRCGGPPCARPGPGGGPRPARTRSRAGRNPDAAQQMEGRPSLGRVKTPGR